MFFMLCIYYLFDTLIAIQLCILAHKFVSSLYRLDYYRTEVLYKFMMDNVVL
jgi:hypothetical protein